MSDTAINTSTGSDLPAPSGAVPTGPALLDRPLAVVTGASSGIGFHLACELASRGHDVIAAADGAGLDDAVRRIGDAAGETGAEATAVRVDLRTPEGVEELTHMIRASGRPVALLALNAGVGAGGAFADETDLDRELSVIDLNVRSTVHLAKRVIPEMVRHGDGRVLFTSSIASTMPGSHQAVYNASKSFVQSFALALRDELRDTGVTVTSLMPGPTDTRFFARAGMLGTRVDRGKKDDPADVARQGVDAALEGRERVVAASLLTKAEAAGSRLMPDRVKAAAHRLMATRRGGQPGSSS